MQSCNYRTIYDLAATRKGGEENLELLVRQHLPNPNLADVPEDRFLAEFTRKVFQSGFVWRVVDNKWLAFEELFWGFDVDKLLMMPDDMLERKAADPAIIRNLKKVWSIRENALMIREIRDREGSFPQFIADWPEEDIIGLWQFLKKHGSRLGGNIGPYALRFLGKDTFLLSRDVEAFLREREIIEGGLTTKRSLAATQNFFNELQQQSDRSLCELSRLVAFSAGENRVVVTEEKKEAEPA
ncbi:DNA-3-methyladenine glycosylase I [Sansalvadorimonas sp. 2012CJ34-2]|uniref:DNA-3-methyladenine glycosylase I n=1 Tax=Parendozoicomonas callyspongiae TaxID=2942213 RepID=A0ABT0PNY3_9GAMM|nr:DNA-3-methyladenine glycosylase I [Sansalvadorimonas sp. 2012CJ34-2]MCL6272158.1 DNA-3-methyladenine glycosylase I [Sansalvadorimonas sp. 2012CJ34-2]